MPREPRTYQLTTSLVASSVGSGVMCLAAEGLGRSYRLYRERPGAAFNRRAIVAAGGIEWRADLPSGAAHVVAPVESSGPSLIRVDIAGPIEQRAGFHDPCSGWTDGHDAIAERLCAAFEQGDVLLVVDSPGGAAAGLQQGVDRALKVKTKYGRRVTVFANEMIGSAAMWWACAVGDELYLPIAGQVGSIGARGGHKSIAGALEKEGIAVRYFTWPNEGKIALAPELPLSAVGEARGNRDVAITGEAFCAAVLTSPIGQRHGLTRDRVMALGADMLTGQAAVDAGLADGVASEDEVTAYALRMAERGAQKSVSAQVRARGDSTMTVRSNDGPLARAEGDAPESEPSEKMGAGIPTACASCGVENAPIAKFCMGCGGSMATKPLDVPGGEDGDEAPPSSRPMPGPAARMTSTASFAELLGLSADASVPAQKSALIDMRQVFDHAASITGHTTAPGIVSQLTRVSKDAAESGRLRAERNKAIRAQESHERADLCKRLVACGGEPRGRVFVDTVSEDGKRTSVSLTPQFAEMRLAVLRDLVTDHEKSAAPRNPFEPDSATAAAVSKGAQQGGDKSARVERAKTNPKVIEMANRPGNTLSIDKLAAAFVAQDFDL